MSAELDAAADLILREDSATRWRKFGIRLRPAYQTSGDLPESLEPLRAAYVAQEMKHEYWPVTEFWFQAPGGRRMPR